jgi:serine/threonine protein phosphatase 1
MRWIVGDIHGMFCPLDALISQVERRDAGAHFIFVGDYINRGPDSPQVIDRLLQLPRATFLRGNHDDVLDLILHNTCYMCHDGAPNAQAAFGWFMQHGLAETLTAYGADLGDLEHLWHHPHSRKLRELVEIVPQPHRQFIRNLLPVVEHDDIFVAHAFWDPDAPDDSPPIIQRLSSSPRLRHQLLWGRYTTDQLRRKKRWKRTGYFGHTPVLNYEPVGDLMPIFRNQIVLVDTAAALLPHGRLSAVCADGGQIVQVQRDGSLVPEDAFGSTGHLSGGV